jgi:hypothetical protein
MDLMEVVGVAAGAATALLLGAREPASQVKEIMVGLEAMFQERGADLAAAVALVDLDHPLLTQSPMGPMAELAFKIQLQVPQIGTLVVVLVAK